VSNPASSGLYGLADSQHVHVLKQSDHVAIPIHAWKTHSWESQSLREQMLRANRQLPNSHTG
jgi:hypothetical protein